MEFLLQLELQAILGQVYELIFWQRNFAFILGCFKPVDVSLRFSQDLGKPGQVCHGYYLCLSAIKLMVNSPFGSKKKWNLAAN